MAESADGLVGETEAPRLHAQPTEVFEGIPHVRELPVENGPDAVRADDEVAVAEVAVNQGVAPGVGHLVLEPAQRELEHRMGLGEAIDDHRVAAPAGSGGRAHARSRKVREAPAICRHVQRVDSREDSAGLLGHAAPSDPHRGRRAGSSARIVSPSIALHHVALSEAVPLVEQVTNGGNRNPARLRGLERARTRWPAGVFSKL